ncbi:MAG TPA: hypothetical protein PLF30_03855 [Candidatus Moranbacteria bacterium]|jgi:hypothetical protein|nr:hypothetical protein [Candidatus Moranbacteria bacterium]HOF42268.1 hypothetical protein [Candidatus Moranbacteria bacterium]HPX94661.1 hypothetical protein [Candidatus Moranbacteria bacterium]HQB59843.1 hypothetical protein [Candidatus Moranbacteria bacterium]
MKSIQYFKILKEAFVTVWKNKFLWLFGFFVILGSAGSSINIKNSESDSEVLPSQLISFFQDNPMVAVFAVLAFLFLILALFLLRLVGTAAIVKSANNIKVYRQSKIRKIISETKKYIWRLFLLEVFVGIALALLAIILFVPIAQLFVLKAYALGILSLIGAAAIMLGLIVISFFLIKYGIFYIILTNMKLRQSLESAYSLFRKNIKESLLMAAILFVLNIFAFILFLTLLTFISIAFIPLVLIAFLVFAKTGVIIILTVALIIILTMTFFLSSIFAAFMQTAWLLFFKQIAADKNDEEKFAEKLAAENKIPSPEVI